MGRKNLNLLDKSISPGRIVMYLAWPTIIEQILQTMVQYVDTAMVGSIGITATAAIGVNTSTIWLINGLMNAAGIGFSIVVARMIGAGMLEEAKKTVRQAIMVAAIGGVFLTLASQLIAPILPRLLGADLAVIPEAVSYMRIFGSVYFFNMCIVMCSNILRCSGDTRTPLAFNVLTNVINVVGNFLLIYPTRTLHIGDFGFTMPGAGMGLQGAAIATALATAVSGSCLLGAMYVKKHSPIRITLKGDYRPDRYIMREAVKLALPTALERATISFGQIALTALITSAGTVALAAHQLATTAESLSYLPVYGFSTAATTLVAQSLGANEKELGVKYAKRCTLYGVLIMAFTGALLFIFAPQLMRIFTKDAGVIAAGAIVLKIEAFAEPFFALATVISGVLRGAGDTRWPFYISLMGMWGVRIPVAILLIKVFSLGLTGAWIGMALDLLVRGIACYIRFHKGNWLASFDLRNKTEVKEG